MYACPARTQVQGYFNFGPWFTLSACTYEEILYATHYYTLPKCNSVRDVNEPKFCSAKKFWFNPSFWLGLFWAEAGRLNFLFNILPTLKQMLPFMPFLVFLSSRAGSGSALVPKWGSVAPSHELGHGPPKPLNLFDTSKSCIKSHCL